MEGDHSSPPEGELSEEEPGQEDPTRRRAGRLVEEGWGLTDQEKDEVADEAEEDVDEPSAEESAVRIEEEPAGLTEGPDRYVEE